MNATTPLLQVGAGLCFLIGLLYSVVTAQGLFDGAFYSRLDALILISYTLLAFVPFVAFIYPKLKTHRKPVFLGMAAVEIAILGLFLWNILFLDD